MRTSDLTTAIVAIAVSLIIIFLGVYSLHKHKQNREKREQENATCLETKTPQECLAASRLKYPGLYND